MTPSRTDPAMHREPFVHLVDVAHEVVAEASTEERLGLGGGPGTGHPVPVPGARRRSAPSHDRLLAGERARRATDRRPERSAVPFLTDVEKVLVSTGNRVMMSATARQTSSGRLLGDGCQGVGAHSWRGARRGPTRWTRGDLHHSGGSRPDLGANGAAPSARRSPLSPADGAALCPPAPPPLSGRPARPGDSLRMRWSCRGARAGPRPSTTSRRGGTAPAPPPGRRSARRP